jgi:hypothetical protein
MEGSMARKPTDEVQLKLRFDERLRRRIEKEAERNNRSMNAEIIHRLEESFRQEDTQEMANKAAKAAIVQYLAQNQDTAGHARGTTTIGNMLPTKPTEQKD